MRKYKLFVESQNKYHGIRRKPSEKSVKWAKRKSDRQREKETYGFPINWSVVYLLYTMNVNNTATILWLLTAIYGALLCARAGKWVYDDCCLLAFCHFYTYSSSLFVVVESPSSSMLTIDILWHQHSAKCKLGKLLLDCESNVISLRIRCLFSYIRLIFFCSSASFSSDEMDNRAIKHAHTSAACIVYEAIVFQPPRARCASLLSWRQYQWYCRPQFTCTTIWKIEMPWMRTYELNTRE